MLASHGGAPHASRPPRACPRAGDDGDESVRWRPLPHSRTDALTHFRPMAEDTFDLIVLGGGPGGYVAAIRAAQLGLKTACVEKESALGGTCVRVGCIPSKALLDSTELFDQIRHKSTLHGITVAEPRMDVGKMHARKDAVVKANTDGVAFLFKKNKIEWVRGFGRLTSPEMVEVQGEGGARTLRAKTV